MNWWIFGLGRKRPYADESDHDGVPLHRTYGVKRKRRVIAERTVTVFAGSVLFYVLGVLALALLAIVSSILMFIDIFVATVFVLSVGTVMIMMMTKTLRKRRKLQRKIKKLCKKGGYTLTRERKGMRSYSWDPRTPDFILHTQGYSYYVHYVTVGHYNSSMTFESKEKMQLVKYPLNNPFTIIFGRKPKRIDLPIGFDTLSEGEEKKSIRVIIVNPVCREMFAKSRDGGSVATGNGFSDFGYTVFTGSGFCEAVERYEAKIKNI